MTSDVSTWLVGVHAVGTALRNDPDRVQELWALARPTRGRVAELQALAESAGIPISVVDEARLAVLAGRSSHQGIAARYLAPPQESMASILTRVDEAGRDALVLLLDGVQDPGNLGACLRTAECVGVTGVVLPKRRAVGITPTVHKASAGAASRLAIAQVTNLVDAVKRLKDAGLWIVGAAAEANDVLYDLDLTGPLGVAVGGEEKGLRPLIKKHCDFLAAIPMAGQTSSLNVSVATGVCLFEAARQRSHAAPNVG